MNDVLSAGIKRLNVKGWGKLADCIGSLTSDSAANMRKITSAEIMGTREVIEVTRGLLPSVNSVVAVWDESTDDLDFYTAVISSTRLIANPPPTLPTGIPGRFRR